MGEIRRAQQARSAALPGARAAPSLRPLERLLRLFTDIRAGEGPQLLLLTSTNFLILTAYYVLKPVREALILAQPGGAELKSYALGGQALLLLAVVPLYGALATRMSRNRLINGVTLFFIACLPVFYVLAERGVPVGLGFFLWIGIFSLMVIAQFWAFANDLYRPEAGKRLFALIAFGASAGAVAGAVIARWLIPMIGVHQLLLLAAAILGANLLLFNLVDHRARVRETPAGTAEARQPIGGANPFAVVFRRRYLVLIALLIFLLNWVNATGEYILGRLVWARAASDIAAGTLRAEHGAAVIGHFYAGYFQVINVVGMLTQLFLVSRLIKYLGVPLAVCLLPLLATGCYAVAALAPALAIFRWVKTAERSADYSLQNTVSQVLYLPTTREEKYKAKQAIDTLAVRGGDLLSAATVFVGTGVLALTASHFATVNVLLALASLVTAVAVGREFRWLDPRPAASASA